MARTGVFISRGGTGEGAPSFRPLPGRSQLARKCVGQGPCNVQHFPRKQLWRLQNHSIRDSHGCVSQTFEFCVPARIVLGLTWLGMDAPIQLHNQAPPGAAEINNVPIDGMLAPELKALKPESP